MLVTTSDCTPTRLCLQAGDEDHSPSRRACFCTDDLSSQYSWIVERTFAWLSTWRRLAKDYELLPSSEEAWIYIAMTRIMLRRLAQDSS
jgi:transposase